MVRGDTGPDRGQKRLVLPPNPPPKLGGEEGRREEGERGRNTKILRTGSEGKKGKGGGKKGDERGGKWAGTEAPP